MHFTLFQELAILKVYTIPSIKCSAKLHISHDMDTNHTPKKT